MFQNRLFEAFSYLLRESWRETKWIKWGPSLFSGVHSRCATVLQTGAENPVCADCKLYLRHWLTPAGISEQWLRPHVQHFLRAAEALRDKLLLPMETSRTQSVRTSAKWLSSTFWDWFLSSGHLIVRESFSRNQRHSNVQHNRAEITLWSLIKCLTGFPGFFLGGSFRIRLPIKSKYFCVKLVKTIFHQ